MPSTYNPLLRLELQATGENATTWGIKTNTNINLLADSIAGATTINVAGSGDYTLSTANGADDESRHSILLLTGLLTGNRNVIVPTSSKNYVVRNSTTGSFTLTVKTAAGTGIVIPTGYVATIFCDGTNVVAAGAPYNATTSAIAGTATGNVSKSGDTMTGDLNITKTDALLTLNSAVGAAVIEVGGQSVAYIDLKTPITDDYDLRLITDAGGGIIQTPGGNITLTAAGVASFSAIPEGPASNPTTDNQLARKAYVDTKAASGAITASGLTQATSRLLGRTTSGTGAVEEISVGAGLALSAGSLAAGGRAYTEYTTYSALTDTIPADDTIPQSSEGTQILSASITPKNAANRVRARVIVRGLIQSDASRQGVVALFRGAGTDAIAATCATLYLASQTQAAQTLALEFEDSPGSTSTQTYTVRVGPSGGTLYINGSTSARLLGGAMRATLVLEEIIL